MFRVPWFTSAHPESRMSSNWKSNGLLWIKTVRLSTYCCFVTNSAETDKTRPTPMCAICSELRLAWLDKGPLPLRTLHCPLTTSHGPLAARNESAPFVGSNAAVNSGVSSCHHLYQTKSQKDYYPHYRILSCVSNMAPNTVLITQKTIHETLIPIWKWSRNHINALQGDPSRWWKPPIDLDLRCSAILPWQ